MGFLHKKTCKRMFFYTIGSVSSPVSVKWSSRQVRSVTTSGQMPLKSWIISRKRKLQMLAVQEYTEGNLSTLFYTRTKARGKVSEARVRCCLSCRINHLLLQNPDSFVTEFIGKRQRKQNPWQELNFENFLC